MSSPDSDRTADELDRIADELYALTPGEFTAARDAKAAEARRAGDRAFAAAVAKLRRPVAAAWAVNLLARHERHELHRVVELGAALRQAQDRLAGDELRRLSRQRQGLVAGLAARAGELARAAGHPVSDAVLDDVEATLDAALVDPAAADKVEAGCLSTPLPRPAAALGGISPVSGPSATPPATVRRRAAAEAAAAHERARQAREYAEQELDRVSREAADVERRLEDLRTKRVELSKRVTKTRREEELARRALSKALDRS